MTKQTKKEARLNILLATIYQREYPIYLLASMMKCGQITAIRLIEKYGMETYKKNGTRFISGSEVVKLFSLDEEDCQKYLSNIRQND